MPSNNNDRLEIAKLVIEAIRVLAWPVLVALLLILFHKPLHEVANSFVLKFQEAHKVSIGSLSLEVEAKAREVGNPELGRKVGSLTNGALEHLLLTSRSGYTMLLSTSNHEGRQEFGLPVEADFASLKELEAKGFIKFQNPMDRFLATLNRLPKSSNFRGDSERVWYDATAERDAAKLQELREQGYSLTDSGRQAVDTIVKAVASQLSRG